MIQSILSCLALDARIEKYGAESTLISITQKMLLRFFPLTTMHYALQAVLNVLT